MSGFAIASSYIGNYCDLFGCSALSHMSHTLMVTRFTPKEESVVFTGTVYQATNLLPVHLNTALDNTNRIEYNRIAIGRYNNTRFYGTHKTHTIQWDTFAA